MKICASPRQILKPPTRNIPNSTNLPLWAISLSIESERVVEANLRAADMLKIDRIELIDQKFSTFIDFYDQDIFHLHLQNLRDSGRRHSCRLSLRRSDGSHLRVQLESVIRSGDQDVSGSALMTMTDITELDLARREISALNAELELRVQQRTLKLEQTQSQLLHKEKLAAIGTLAASIAHELNNPLQGVLNVINGINRRATLDPEDAELLDIAVDECKRMRELLKALQDFNRPTSGIRAPLDMHKLIDSVLLLFRKVFATKNILIERALCRQYTCPLWGGGPAQAGNHESSLQ